MVYLHSLSHSGVLAHGPYLMMIVNRSLVTRILDNTITAFSSVVGGKVAVALEDKTLVVVDAVAGNSSVRHVQGLLRKKPSVVEFIAGKNDGLIVADRFGNVQEVDYTRGIGGGEESEEDEDQGVLVGHFGAVTDVKFSSDGKLLISADRDDRIRVSRWPEAYCIQSFCLGHTSFVNKVCVLDDNVIASCSGDGTVRCWNLRSGEMLDYVDLNNVFLDSSNTAEKKSVVVMDLDYDHANGLVFALVEGQNEIALIRFAHGKNTLEFVSKFAVKTETCSLMIYDGRLWVMGESPRIQAFKISKDGLHALDSQDYTLKVVEECNQFLNTHVLHKIEPLHRIFVEPAEKPTKKTKPSEASGKIQEEEDEDDEE